MAKEWDTLQRQSKSLDCNPTEHACHLLKTKPNKERPTNKQQLKSAAVKVCWSFKYGKRFFDMSMGSRFQSSTKRIKTNPYI